MIDITILGLCVVLLLVWSFSIGYKLAEVKDNNYSELFQAYIKNNTELEREKYYWMDCYNQLWVSIPDDLVEDKIVDMRGNVIGVFLKDNKEGREK